MDGNEHKEHNTIFLPTYSAGRDLFFTALLFSEGERGSLSLSDDFPRVP